MPSRAPASTAALQRRPAVRRRRSRSRSRGVGVGPGSSSWMRKTCSVQSRRIVARSSSQPPMLRQLAGAAAASRPSAASAASVALRRRQVHVRAGHAHRRCRTRRARRPCRGSAARPSGRACAGPGTRTRRPRSRARKCASIAARSVARLVADGRCRATRRRSRRARRARSRAGGASTSLCSKRSLRTSQSHRPRSAPCERQLELLGALPALALGARLEQRVGLAPPLAAVQAERRARRRGATKKMRVLRAPAGARRGRCRTSARLTAMTSGLSMCSAGGATGCAAPSPAPRSSRRSGRRDQRAALGARLLRAHRRRRAAAIRPRPGAVSSGMVTNTLPSLWPSETHMSGAYSTERISTLKYSGSRAATAAPAKAPFGATIARPKTTVYSCSSGSSAAGDVERRRALRRRAACGSSRGRRSRGRAARRRCSRRRCPSASSTTIERTPGMASLSTLSRAESRVETSGAAASPGSRRARSPGRGSCRRAAGRRSRR